MKNTLDVVLAPLFATTTEISVTPNQATLSQLSDEEMSEVVGGSWGCALTLAAVGSGYIAAGLAGPIGWGAAIATIASGGFGIAAGCL